MEISIASIAQIITGFATLTVALVLVYQLRQQHRDAEILLTMESWSLNQEVILSEIQSEKLSNIISKSEKGLHNLDNNEKDVFLKWVSLKFGRLVTEWRLGRMSNDPIYYKIHLSNFMNNKAVLEHYKKTARELDIEGSIWKTGIIEIVDEIYERFSGEKIT